MSRFDAFSGILNRPHMAQLNNTLVRKQLTDLAGDEKAAYARYRAMVKSARELGHDDRRIVAELEAEIDRIEGDQRPGDHLFQQGLARAKSACTSAIRLIISEIKGEL